LIFCVLFDELYENNVFFQSISLQKKLVDNRAGMIRSAADTILIRYGPCRYDMYLIRYTCT